MEVMITRFVSYGLVCVLHGGMILDSPGQRRRVMQGSRVVDPKVPGDQMRYVPASRKGALRRKVEAVSAPGQYSLAEGIRAPHPERQECREAAAQSGLVSRRRRPKQTSGNSCYDLTEQEQFRDKRHDRLNPMLASFFRITPCSGEVSRNQRITC